jgi:excisionase family DNA binding protein
MHLLGLQDIDTVYRYIHSGELKAYKIGGNGQSKRHWRIKRKDLEAFIKGRVLS